MVDQNGRPNRCTGSPDPPGPRRCAVSRPLLRSVLVPSPRSRRPRAPSLAVADGRVDNVRRVYEELRGLIVSGELPAGARIAERTVAERLQMSRTPVRSALHR